MRDNWENTSKKSVNLRIGSVLLNQNYFSKSCLSLGTLPEISFCKEHFHHHHEIHISLRLMGSHLSTRSDQIDKMSAIRWLLFFLYFVQCFVSCLSKFNLNVIVSHSWRDFFLSEVNHFFQTSRTNHAGWACRRQFIHLGCIFSFTIRSWILCDLFRHFGINLS